MEKESGQERISVIVVDDEAALRSLFSQFLEDMDIYDVRVCQDGEEALGELRNRPAHVCIVDMRLPGMTGDEFITQAKALCPACSFIVHTGTLGYSPPAALQAAGVTQADIFLKPADMESIEQRIRAIVAGQG